MEGANFHGKVYIQICEAWALPKLRVVGTANKAMRWKHHLHQGSATFFWQEPDSQYFQLGNQEKKIKNIM